MQLRTFSLAASLCQSVSLDGSPPSHKIHGLERILQVKTAEQNKEISTERKRKRLDSRIEEFNLKGSIFHRSFLPDQLIEPVVLHGA